MNEDLKSIFTNVNDWLKYAETKNATLTAFNGAAIFGLLQAWDVMSHELITLNVLLLTVSSLIAIFSFTPRISRVFKLNKYNAQEWSTAKNDVNLLFFGDLSRLAVNQFVEAFGERVQNTPYVPKRIELNLIDQILVNSEIALSKNRLFRSAVRLALIGILINLLFIIHLIFDWLRF